MKPTLVLVGRPNVGKSTLFNRLTRTRDALVADLPGLTRDRHYGHGRLGYKPFLVVDTGGFEPLAKSGIVHEMARQAEAAIAEGDVVLFMVDARAGLAPQDKEIASLLRRAGRPVHLVVNEAYAQGQSTSLRAGIAALGHSVAAAVVLLGDQPFVTPAIVGRLLAAWQNGDGAIVAPVYAGQRGNPVLFARTVFSELLAVQGDQGARSVLAANRERVTLVPFEDARPLADIDTPEEYERLRQLAVSSTQSPEVD